jgi:DNA-directed RNA polymerase specialized sigma24 family protein
MQVRQRDKAQASKVWAQHADDEERLLIERVRASDHEAFEALFHRYLSTIYRQAIRLLGDQAEAEEVVQEVFLTVYEKAHTFQGHSAFSTWLYRITMNAALTKLRQRKRSGLSGRLPAALWRGWPSSPESGGRLVERPR